MSELLRGFLVGIVRQGTFVVGILVSLTSLGISLGLLLTVFGGVSFFLAFALHNNLGNLASGLMIMLYKSFKEGVKIRLGELWGHKELTPRTLVWEIDGDSMNIMFFGHIKTQEYWQVHEAVLTLIQKGINEAGIEIDIPEQKIQIESVDKSELTFN